MSDGEQFENYLLERFQVDRVSNGTQLLINDDCPFNGCGAGRMYVNRKTGLGICHKCGRGFSPASFVAEYEQITVSQAKRVLTTGVAEGFKDLEEALVPVEELAVWFPPTVPIETNDTALAYLTGRGMSSEMIATFGITFCQQNVQVGDRLYWTSNRIIIPLFDRNGQAVGWQGRDITGKSKMKYLFMPGFRGADNLFNIHRVKKGGYLIMVEGALDVAGWVKSGVNNVVGTYGKKASAVQVDMLAELEPDTLYVGWDGDASAEKFRFIENHGHRFKRILMLDLGDKDSDECDKKALLNAINRATPYRWEDKILQAL